MLLGRGKGRRDVLPGNIAGGQYSAVGSDHSNAVVGVVDAGSDVAVSTILPFASRRYSYWLQRFPIEGNCTVPPPFLA